METEPKGGGGKPDAGTGHEGPPDGGGSRDGGHGGGDDGGHGDKDGGAQDASSRPGDAGEQSPDPTQGSDSGGGPNLFVSSPDAQDRGRLCTTGATGVDLVPGNRGGVALDDADFRKQEALAPMLTIPPCAPSAGADGPSMPPMTNQKVQPHAGASAPAPVQAPSGAASAGPCVTNGDCGGSAKCFASTCQ
jgi:hypothetical protein